MVSPQTQRSKIQLPTIDSCRWRVERGDSAESYCGLVQQLLGPDEQVDTVSIDACQACCETFPPTPGKLNSVVGSLVYDHTSRLLTRADTDSRRYEHLVSLNALAQDSLNLIHDSGVRLTPARGTVHCHYLGDRTCLENNSQESLDEETDERACHHPQHDRTTLANCEACVDWTRDVPISRTLSLDELVPITPNDLPPRVRKWSVGVTTSPRRNNSLGHCIDSLVRGGWDAPHLFMDGTVRVPDRYHHLNVTWREQPVGALPNWYFALCEMVMRDSSADAFLLVQDDVILHGRDLLRDYLERALWPGKEPGIVSLFYTGLDTEAGWHEARGGCHWGAQVYVFPPAMARAIAASPDILQASLAATEGRHIPIPEVLYDWTEQHHIETWYPCPSLAQHIGNSSTIWTDASITLGRRAPWFSESIDRIVTLEESLDDFPESAFVSTDELLESYVRQLERGRERMANVRAVICGLCRDARHFLPRTEARIRRLGEMFKDFRVVIFENDSSDATPEFLQDWARHDDRFELLTEIRNEPRHPQVRSRHRATAMANYRNQYHEHVVTKWADFDFVIVVDTDLAGGWSYDGIAHSMGADDWDFIGSYGLRRRLDNIDEFPFNHYDAWAFRPAKGTDARTQVDHSKFICRRGDPMVSVESCFGGLGIYTMRAFSSGKYSGNDCEHVDFHHQLAKSGCTRLFMNPSQIVLYTPL